MWTSADLAVAAAARPEAVAHLGLRTTSPVVAEALGLAATGGLLTASELLERLGGSAADGTGSAGLTTALGEAVTAPPVAAGLALLWCGRGDEAPLRAGAALYRWLAATGELAALHPVHHHAAGQGLYLAGEHDALRQLLPELGKMPDDVRHYLETDLAHPRPGAQDQQAHRRWEALLSARFVEHGLSPLAVGPQGHSPHLFDHLRGTVAPGRVHGPLVTVVIPCFRPDEGLFTSVASIAGQTYADLEIVLVDDASGPEHRELIAAAADLDPRARVLTLEQNGGSYLARRAALAASTGALVTTQDADDWSHPERMEQQVALLHEHPEAPASRSQAVRAKDDLTHQWFGYRALRANASSLMVRREVLETCGSFLPIRKSADSEYAERVQHLLAKVADTRTPLAVTRLRTGSLSRGDFSYQWSHPDRIAFRGTYRAWHRSLRASGATDVPPYAMPEVPQAFGRGIPQAVTLPTEVDVCLLGDFSDPPASGGRRSRRRLLDRLSGRRVGLWHVERPRALTRARPEMHPGWFDLVVATPDLHLVTRTQHCRVGTVVVLDPSALLLSTAQATTVHADRVEVVLDEAALAPSPSGLPPDLLGVSDACHDWWGLRPTWVTGPDAPAEESRLRDTLPGLPVEPGLLAARHA
jgi:O-antigen biosynthesis protein